MDQELVDYIINHYSYFFSLRESAAYKHSFAAEKAGNFKSQELKDKIIRYLGTNEKDALQLLNNGFQEFKRRSAERILKEHPDEVVINLCPQCGRLARTPLAKQCRQCGHNWH
ncbi:MAG TPA: hypothetical protein VD884_12445 [Ohtaekwangia sp.]|nr:hypothetical protein [Ohtaekwangia sp.]